MKTLLALLLTVLTCCGAGFGFNAPSPSLQYGLVGWWTANTGSGTTATDYSGNANTGTLAGGASWTNGVIGNCLYFGASGNRYVSFAGGDPFTIANNYSTCGWARRTGGSSYQCLIGDAAGDSWVAINGTTPFFQVNISGSYKTITSTNDVTSGWHHYVLTKSSTAGFSAYLDGTLIGNTSSVTGAVYTAVTHYIGNTTYPFVGAVDDVRLYNRVISAAEVKAIYSGGYGSQ